MATMSNFISSLFSEEVNFKVIRNFELQSSRRTLSRRSGAENLFREVKSKDAEFGEKSYKVLQTEVLDSSDDFSSHFKHGILMTIDISEAFADLNKLKACRYENCATS